MLGERIKELYKDLYNIDTEIHQKNQDEIKGAVNRVTGKDKKSVDRYVLTFSSLSNMAKFGVSPKTTKVPESAANTKEKQKKDEHSVKGSLDGISLNQNIQIQLPMTKDTAVYNAIFQSIRENLLD